MISKIVKKENDLPKYKCKKEDKKKKFSERKRRFRKKFDKDKKIKEFDFKKIESGRKMNRGAR